MILWTDPEVFRSTQLTIEDGGVVYLESAAEFTEVLITSGGELGHREGKAGFDLTVLSDMEIKSGGALSTNGKGYSQNSGPGAGSGNYAGAGHGGVGKGSGSGGTYGSILEPRDFGSGGGISPGYKKIQRDNFTILGVSYERDAQMHDGEEYRNASVKTWKKSICENNMSWPNVNDYGGIIIKGNKSVSPVAKTYDLNYYNIPQCLLIGPDGKILLRTYVDSDLVEKVHEIVGGTLAREEGENSFKIGGQMLTYPKVEWLKGSPITKFSKDSIYIIDLWATWCKPCVAAMPHLNALHEKFKDNVIFIAQNVWEGDKEKVKNFLQKEGSNWNFRIAFSGPNGSVFDKEWCTPAFVSGIPVTFVIQNNKLLWQTHPTKLTVEIVQSLIDGTFKPREKE